MSSRFAISYRAMGRIALGCLLASGLLIGACAPSDTPVGSLVVHPAEVALGFPEAVELELSWSPSAELSGLSGTPRVFVHLLDSSGELVRTFDHPLPTPWEPGRTIEYALPVYQSAIAPALPAGSYTIRVGLYDEAGNRWSLDAVGEVSNAAYHVVDLEIASEAQTLPTFSFSSSWLPEEAGRDQQVLTRRWLWGDGNLRMIGVDEPGTVWLRLATPSGPLQNHTLVLAEGETQPAVVMTNSCDGTTDRLAVDEAREFRIRVQEDCEVTLAANYHWEEAETGTSRSLALEGLAWIRDAG